MFYLTQPVGSDWWGENGVFITQLFGENANDFYRKLGMIGHNGIDYRTQYYQRYLNGKIIEGAAPIMAAHDGWVVSDKTIQSDTKGRFVEIMTDEIEIDGRKCKVKTVYFHLSEARVSITDDLEKPWYDWSRWAGKSGRWIKGGAILIGWGGNTGEYTTGAHLHFGMYIYWKQPDGSYKKEYGNGYDGAVDPMPYFRDNTVYQYGESIRRFYYNGKIITDAEAKKLIIPKFR